MRQYTALFGFLLKADPTRAVRQLLGQRKGLGLTRQGRSKAAAGFAWAGSEGGFRVTSILCSLPSSVPPCPPAGDSRDLENGRRMPGRASPRWYRAGTRRLFVCSCLSAQSPAAHLIKGKMHKPRVLCSFFRIKLTFLSRLLWGRLTATAAFAKHGHESEANRQG